MLTTILNNCPGIELVIDFARYCFLGSLFFLKIKSKWTKIKEWKNIEVHKEE